ncbi:hypothetical protein K1719_041128 [Acacia pycnantha]|nr:hypothetical protein K1719_041128 [Acacia pycnantha]
MGTSKDMMRRENALSLMRIPESLKNIIPDLWQSIGGGMNGLTCLALHDSDGIECVIGQSNPSQIGIISNLTQLTLIKVKRLKTLYSGHPPQGLFANLEKLSIDSCDSLEHILTEDAKEIVMPDLLKVVVASVESLERLDLWNHEVEVVFEVEQLSINGQQVNSKLSHLRFFELPQLTHIWREEDDQKVSHSSRQLVFPKLVTICIKRCHKLKCVLPNISACRGIPNLRALYIEDAPALEQVFGHEQHDTSLEYVILWNLPSLTSVAPSIALQTVEYIVVQQCPKLSLTSSITPQELLKQLSKGYFIGDYLFEKRLENIIKSMDDSSKETMQQINCQETGGQSKDQKLTIIATPNLTENKKESEDQRAHEREMSKEKSIGGLEGQIAQNEDISRENDVKGISEGSLSFENAKIIAPSIDSKLATSSTKSVSNNKKESEDPSARKRDMSEEKSEEVRAEEYTSSNNVRIVPSLAHSEPASSSKTVRDLEIRSAQKETISMENDVKGSFEVSLSSENAKMITPSTLSHIQTQIKFNPSNLDVEDMKEDDLISVLEAMEDEYGSKSPISSDPTIATAKDELVAKALADLEDSLKMPLKDIATSEANCLHMQTVLNFLSHPSLEDRALSQGVMATTKSMHKDLPDILSSFKQAYATVNKVAVLEERDKSIKYQLSQRKEVAIDLVSKTSEAQEKEASLKEQISRLEKERKYYEAELLSLQEQKRKYIAETVKFKKEIETVRKEKSEMLEDQRNAQQQLVQADHRWILIEIYLEANKFLILAYWSYTDSVYKIWQQFDDADSGAGSDDFGLLEFGETGEEVCQIGNQTCNIL